VDVDVAVVGAGGAGLSLVAQLEARARARGVRPPTAVLVDPVRKEADDRTWCFWDAGSSDVDPVVTGSWTSVDLVGTRGGTRSLDLTPLRYVMVRSSDFYALARSAGDRLGVTRLAEPATDVVDGRDRAVVHVGGQRLSARWVFDSRPTPPVRAARTALLQHFRGWLVETDEDLVPADRPTFMDFSVPQPRRGVAFAYCLPVRPGLALLEYTEFSADRLAPPAYDAALNDYLRRRWGLAPGDVRVVGSEEGGIPMTDAVYARRAGRRIFRLGTAGGATRPSTGYTFAAMQRQARAVADALIEGGVPLPPRPYPRRHRWMDAVLLRAVAGGRADPPELFARLFDANPPERVLRFLDGTTTLAEELAVMRSSPRGPMARAALGDAVVRARRRVRPPSRGAGVSSRGS
jgi:lycopene beta-cyclase